MSQIPDTDELSILRQTLEDYRTLCNTTKAYWPELSFVAISNPKPEKVKVNKSCFDKIMIELNKPGQHGWARFRSDVDWTGSNNIPSFDDWGEPLFSEWTLSKDASKRLRLDPDDTGTANIWHYTERPLEADDTLEVGERAFLCETSSVLAHPLRAPIERLYYHVFWGSPKGSNPYALQRIFDRFTGFGPGDID